MNLCVSLTNTITIILRYRRVSRHIVNDSNSSRTVHKELNVSGKILDRRINRNNLPRVTVNFMSINIQCLKYWC